MDMVVEKATEEHCGGGSPSPSPFKLLHDSLLQGLKSEKPENRSHTRHRYTLQLHQNPLFMLYTPSFPCLRSYQLHLQARQ